MPTINYHWKQARAYRKGRAAKIATIILHSTDGHREGDVATLTEGPVSVHWYVTKDGQYYHFVDDADTAYHAGQVLDASRYSNAATVGIEQEHVDHEEPWPDLQVRATAALVAALIQRHACPNSIGGPLPYKSHAAVAAPPGRKEDPVDFPWTPFAHYVQEASKSTWSFAEITTPPD